MKPRQHVSHRLNAVPVGYGGAVDQDHRQVQRTGGIKLGTGTGAAGVLGDDMADVVGLQHGKVAFQGEGASRDDGFGVRQGQAGRRVDKPQKIMMLGLCGKNLKLLATDGEEDFGRVIGQGRQRRLHRGHVLPAVARAGLPRLTLQRQQRQVGDFRGLYGVRADLGGEGMGGVQDVGDSFSAQIADQTLNAAKAADAVRQGLGDRAFGSSGVGEYACNALIGQGFGKLRGLGCAAEQKDAGHG